MKIACVWCIKTTIDEQGEENLCTQTKQQKKKREKNVMKYLELIFFFCFIDFEGFVCFFFFVISFAVKID